MRRLASIASRLGALRRSSNATAYETRAQPAPGVPFHVAIPVHNIDVAKQFYGETLGLEEGRSSTKWQDYAMHRPSSRRALGRRGVPRPGLREPRGWRRGA